MGHQKQIEQLKTYLNKIPSGRDPETEEEFIYALEYWGKFMVNQAASEYGRLPLGIISYDTKIDEGKVTKNFDPEFLKLISHLVKLACERFNLSQPGPEHDNSRTSFKEWFNSVAEKYDLKVRYDERIFNNQAVL
ncbi:MAG: hypothetical protein ABIC36_02635 [bacterium]